MSEINLKLKTYDELTFEITRLNTDKYLLEQKLQQKENIIKEVREEVRILESNCDISNYHAQKLYQTLDKEEVN